MTWCAGVQGAAKLAILAVGLANLVVLFGQTPVGNAGLRDGGPTGDWRAPQSIALYDTAAYDRDLALDYLSVAATTGDAAARRKTRDLAWRSVMRAPSDPAAWQLVSWGEMLLGNDAAARRALLRSWQIAPNAAALAGDRIVLAEILGLAENGTGDPAVMAALRRDLAAVETHAPRQWASLPEFAPTVLALARASVDDTDRTSVNRGGVAARPTEPAKGPDR